MVGKNLSQVINSYSTWALVLRYKTIFTINGVTLDFGTYILICNF